MAPSNWRIRWARSQKLLRRSRAYAYNATGYQSQLSNSATSQVYWTANARDAELHLTKQTAGNGVVTNQVFDPTTGQLTNITGGDAGAVQNHTYTYDLLGKLLTRSDANTSLSESFGYDTLNRLTSSTVSLNPTPLVATFAFNAIGNLIAKSDVGTYSYPAPGQPRPHGVTSISGGVINTSFTEACPRVGEAEPGECQPRPSPGQGAT